MTEYELAKDLVVLQLRVDQLTTQVEELLKEIRGEEKTDG